MTTLEAKRKDIEDQLREPLKSAPIQAVTSTKRQQLREIKARISESYQKLNVTILWPHFPNYQLITVSISEKLNEMKNLNKLPEPYNKQLIDEILAKECICGRDVQEGSDVFNVLERLRETAPGSSYTEKLINFKAFCHAQKDISDVFEETIEVREKIVELENRSKLINEEIQEKENLLETMDDNLVNELQRVMKS